MNALGENQPGGFRSLAAAFRHRMIGINSSICYSRIAFMPTCKLETKVTVRIIVHPSYPRHPTSPDPVPSSNFSDGLRARVRTPGHDVGEGPDRVGLLEAIMLASRVLCGGPGCYPVVRSICQQFIPMLPFPILGRFLVNFSAAVMEFPPHHPPSLCSGMAGTPHQSESG